MHMSLWGTAHFLLRNITKEDAYENGVTFGERLKTRDLKNRFLNVLYMLRV